MNKTEFIQIIDNAIHDQLILGVNKNALIGYRNIKSDFNYISSKDGNLTVTDIVKKLYKERCENAEVYKDTNRLDLWIQENTEKTILEGFLPDEPSEKDILLFLETLKDVPKQKSSFKIFQEKCIEKFGQKVDSKIILDFISG